MHFLVVGFLLLALSVGLSLGFLTGWLPAQFVPRALIIRGNYLTPTAEIASALQFTGRESYFTLWHSARSQQQYPTPWLKSLRLRPLAGRCLLVTVEERLPLVPLKGAGSEYWLCDDGQLVPQDLAGGNPLALVEANKVPLIDLPDDPGQGELANAAALLQIAACCQQELPARIKRIRMDRSGEFTLYEVSGLQIKLGSEGDLLARIAALPKALRICEANRSSLRYLDASDPGVFYQKWNHTISSKTGSNQ